MHWTTPGAQAIGPLRAAHLSNRWEDAVAVARAASSSETRSWVCNSKAVAKRLGGTIGRPLPIAKDGEWGGFVIENG